MGSALITGGTIEKEGRILLVRHSNSQKKDYGHWLLPAGKVEPGESTLGALHRELREELGIPTLDLEGREFFATESSRIDMNKRLEEFLDMCIANKK